MGLREPATKVHCKLNTASNVAKAASPDSDFAARFSGMALRGLMWRRAGAVRKKTRVKGQTRYIGMMASS